MSSKYTVPQPGSISSAGSAVDMTRLVMEAARLQTEAFAQVVREQSEAAAVCAHVEAGERREAHEARKKQEGGWERRQHASDDHDGIANASIY